MAVAATAAPVVTAAVEGAESVPTSEPAPAADPDSIEARLARAEEELRLLREEREARENMLTQPAVPPAPKKRRHRRFLPILITILVLLGAAAAFFLHSDFKKDLEAYRLVEARVKEDPMTMDVTVDASYGKISLSADASVARTKKDGAPITCIERDGAALYYADGAIYLENGKSYAVGGAFPNYAELMDETAELCRTLTVTRSVDGQEKRYTLTAEGDDASTLLRLLTSDDIANAASLSAIRVDLTAESGELMDVSFTAENSGDLRVEAAAHFTDALAPVIPDDVLTAIHSGSNDDASTLTDNALRLLGAWGELTADDLSADIALSADCGPIVLNSTLQYDRSSIDGQSYGSIRKNTLAVYFSGSKICDADGNSVDTASQQLVDATSLIDLCYQSILNGSAGCDKVSDGYLYGLSLDSDAMSELAAAIGAGYQGTECDLLLRTHFRPRERAGRAPVRQHLVQRRAAPHPLRRSGVALRRHHAGGSCILDSPAGAQRAETIEKRREIHTMGNRIISISRQFGSGGHEVAVKTADLLGIRVYERELIRLACEYGELSEKTLSPSDEKATNPYLFQTVHEGNHHVLRGKPTSEVLFALQSHEIRRIARHEECVFVGRCADYVLRGEDVRLLTVFVDAPDEHRIQRKMAQEKLTRDQAIRLIRKMDKQRRKYYESYTHKAWGAPEGYDLYLDTGALSTADAAAVIAERFRRL